MAVDLFQESIPSFQILLIGLPPLPAEAIVLVLRSLHTIDFENHSEGLADSNNAYKFKQSFTDSPDQILPSLAG